MRKVMIRGLQAVMVVSAVTLFNSFRQIHNIHQKTLSGLHDTQVTTNATPETETVTLGVYNTAVVQETVPGHLRGPGYTEFLQEYLRDCQARAVPARPPQCPCLPASLRGRLAPNLNVHSWTHLQTHLTTWPGGRWAPSTCTPREHLLVVIPMRDRETHLQVLLSNLHPMLQRQMLAYRVVVVEQDDSLPFNKGAMMNLAFREARWRRWACTCVFFHDVDMLSQDDRNMFTCGDSPRHVAPYIDKFNYRLMYGDMFGGVVAMRPELFEKVNGYSTSYWGWGSEDDDMGHRLKHVGAQVVRWRKEVAQFTMIKHHKDGGNPANLRGGVDLSYTTRLYKQDGLMNMNYTVTSLTQKPLYTHIKAIYNAHTPQINFTVTASSCDAKRFYSLWSVSIAACKQQCSAFRGLCMSFVYDTQFNACYFNNLLCKRQQPSRRFLLFSYSYASQFISTETKHKLLHPAADFRVVNGDCGGFGDLRGSTRDGTLQECLQYCRSRKDCVGFSRMLNEYATCFFKTKICDKPVDIYGIDIYLYVKR